MNNRNHTVRLGLVLLVGFISGCAASIACRPGDSTVDCCIKNHPLTPLDSCTASRQDALRVLRDIALKIDEGEFENNKDLPEWKQACIQNYVHCQDEGWGGPCYDCLRRCEGQQKWPAELCSPPEDE